MMKVKQPLQYLFWAWVGRKLYGFREFLETLQYDVDDRAGRYWKEC